MTSSEAYIAPSISVGDLSEQASIDRRFAAIDERLAKLEEVALESLQTQQESLEIQLQFRDIQVQSRDLLLTLVGRATAATPSMDSPVLGMSTLSMRAPSAASSAQSSAKSAHSRMLCSISLCNRLTSLQLSALVRFFLLRSRVKQVGPLLGIQRVKERRLESDVYVLSFYVYKLYLVLSLSSPVQRNEEFFVYILIREQ